MSYTGILQKYYMELLRKFTIKRDYTGLANKKFKETYEDLSENLSENDLKRVNNLFVLFTGISLDTLFNSESVEDLYENNYVELTEEVGE